MLGTATRALSPESMWELKSGLYCIHQVMCPGAVLQMPFWLICTRTMYRLVTVLGMLDGGKELVFSVACSVSSKQMYLCPWPTHPTSRLNPNR